MQNIYRDLILAATIIHFVTHGQIITHCNLSEYRFLHFKKSLNMRRMILAARGRII